MIRFAHDSYGTAACGDIRVAKTSVAVSAAINTNEPRDELILKAAKKVSWGNKKAIVMGFDLVFI